MSNQEGYMDDTADTAIAHVMRDEKKKRKLTGNKNHSPGQPNPHKSKEHGS